MQYNGAIIDHIKTKNNLITPEEEEEEENTWNHAELVCLGAD